MNKDIRYKGILGGTHKYLKQKNGKYYIEQCRGCKTYEDGMESLSDEDKKIIVYLCNMSVPFKASTGEYCPCSTCVVKMMCTNKCEELDLFIETPTKVGDKRS